jgi:hypothetical protein
MVVWVWTVESGDDENGVCLLYSRDTRVVVSSAPTWCEGLESPAFSSGENVGA